MSFFNFFKVWLSKIFNLNPKLEKVILSSYYKSIFYRLKHVKKEKYSWLNEIELNILNNKEGLLIYKNLKFILRKNNLELIPLHQKYLYAALITAFGIPKYYLYFWDDLVVFHEIFIEKIYGKYFNIKKGDTVLDIGASIGWFTCKVAFQVGNNGKVIAIEPNPKNSYYLTKNIELNNLENVISVNIGAWSSDRKAKLSQNKYVSSLKILPNREQSHIEQKHATIDLNTIDNIVSKFNLKKVNLIKMDIEGAEIEAIKGAINTLESNKKIKLIISAYHKMPSGKQTFHQILPYLERRNFYVIKKELPIIFAEKKNVHN